MPLAKIHSQTDAVVGFLGLYRVLTVPARLEKLKLGVRKDNRVILDVLGDFLVSQFTDAGLTMEQLEDTRVLLIL